MAELTEQQIKEQDIDWYCLVNGSPAHIASMGGMIPKAFRDIDELRTQQEIVARMDPLAEVRLNVNVIDTMATNGYDYLDDWMIRNAILEANKNNPGFLYLNEYSLPVRLFASSFAEMARRGFLSFARREGVEGNEYILIAEPVGSISIDLRGKELKPLECKLINEVDGRIIFF